MRRGTAREVEVGGGDCASVTGELQGGTVQDCEDLLCFRSIGAVAERDWLAVRNTPLALRKGKLKRSDARMG